MITAAADYACKIQLLSSPVPAGSRVTSLLVQRSHQERTIAALGISVATVRRFCPLSSAADNRRVSVRSICEQLWFATSLLGCIGHRRCMFFLRTMFVGAGQRKTEECSHDEICLCAATERCGPKYLRSAIREVNSCDRNAPGRAVLFFCRLFFWAEFKRKVGRGAGRSARGLV